jgi:phosphoglycerate kinase
LENIRFYPGEEANDAEFAQQLAGLGDVYINDAFSNSHREHASIIGLPKILPAAAGLLLAHEVGVLSGVLKNPKRPLAVMIGGVKISSKLKFISKFLHTADNVVLGGALANTVLSAMGLATGRSIIESSVIEELRALNLTDPKLHLPVDAVVAVEPKSDVTTRITAIGNTRPEEMILDIGPDTQSLFGDIIMRAGSVVWAGPMGLCEIPAFSQGMKKIGEAMAKTAAFTIVGGGDTVGFMSKQGLLDRIDYASTGGSAMLDFLASGNLPGLKVLGY